MKARSGGGANSRNVAKQGVRTGTAAKGFNPGRAGQFGISQGNHTERGRVSGDPREAPRTVAPISVPLGNELTTNVGMGGPGVGRTVYASGTNNMHGAPVRGNPPSAGDVTKPWR
jgi:hypothetical protein